MLLFTWNLNRNESAFRMALDHLVGTGESFIATFQELPPEASSTDKATKKSFQLVKDHVRCLGVMGSKRGDGRVGLFSSKDISKVGRATTDRNRRMAMISLLCPHWGDLSVVGFHAVDRRNTPTEYSRGVSADLARLDIEKFWKRSIPLIVMGDFNADPYDPEVSARKGLFAIRDSMEMAKEWASSLLGDGETMRPLYNPTWHLLPESKTRPGGTYLFNSEDRGIRWRICDQILVSREFVDKLNGLPEIISKLGDKDLLTPREHHPNDEISDHLPLQLRVTI